MCLLKPNFVSFRGGFIHLIKSRFVHHCVSLIFISIAQDEVFADRLDKKCLLISVHLSVVKKEMNERENAYKMMDGF